MYYNHNLRTNLQEWKNRLYKASFHQFGNQFKHFLTSLEKEKICMGIINEACIMYPHDDEKLSEMCNVIDRGSGYSFENEPEQVAFSYLFLKYLIALRSSHELHNLMVFQKNNFDDTKSGIIEDYVAPILNFIHDRIDKSSSTIYLLEKYKKRTEWFKKQELFEKYTLAGKNYEQIFEDDLRLFLFDQGIDYPFSTPKSTSGRADIVGAIDTTDPLIMEIKIYDSKKNYREKRISDGFRQIVSYTNDYNKDFGYLVIFNTDDIELKFDFNEKNNYFPPMLTLNNKNYFFIVINIKPQDSASKLGIINSVTITESMLINNTQIK